MSIFRALRHRTFLSVWMGQTISRIGDFTYEIALAWWMLQKTGSPQAMSLVLIFALTPSILFSLVGGVAADRFPRARLMLGSDFLRGIVALVVALLAVRGHLQVSMLYTASLLFGFLDAFFQPAYQSLVPLMVPEDDLPSANALTSLSTSLGRVAGPALGAGLIGLIGTTGAFGINAATFLISSVLLLPARNIRLAGKDAEPSPSLGLALREGLDTVRSTPWLKIGLLVFALTNVTLGAPFSIAMPFLVSVFRHSGVGALACLYAAFPLGYILGGFVLGRLPKLQRRGLTLYSSLAVAAGMLALFGFRLPLWTLLLAALINGAMLEAGQLAWTSLLQEKIPGEQQGRIFSLDAAGSFALLPLGFALVGWLTKAVGPAAVFMLGGGVTALLALGVLISVPTLRRLA